MWIKGGTMARRLAIVLIIALALSVTACGVPRKVSTINMEKAQIELNEYCKSIPSLHSVGEMYIYDVTKDGVEDMCTSVTFGVENIRKGVVVYDVLNGVYYTLSSEFLSYDISKVEKGRLIVYKDEEVKGTVQIEDGALVFVADKK